MPFNTHTTTKARNHENPIDGRVLSSPTRSRELAFASAASARSFQRRAQLNAVDVPVVAADAAAEAGVQGHAVEIATCEAGGTGS
jgi:hypothetical protein